MTDANHLLIQTYGFTADDLETKWEKANHVGRL